MVTDCKAFDPFKDRVPVNPDQAVDLGMVMRTGKVPVTLAPESPSQYNNIANPGNILNIRPKDIFDTMTIQSALRSYADSAKDAKPDSSSSVAPPAAPTSEQ